MSVTLPSSAPTFGPAESPSHAEQGGLDLDEQLLAADVGVQVGDAVGLRQELAFQDLCDGGLVGGVAQVDFEMAMGATGAAHSGPEPARLRDFRQIFQG